jgi:hypothetical protein
MVDFTVHSEHDSGIVHEIIGHPEGVFIPVFDDSDGDVVQQIHAARSPNQPIPDGVVVFRGSEGSREALTRAGMWASVQDRVDFDDLLDYNPGIDDDAKRACVPAVVAGEGSAVIAVYLAAHGFSNPEIADALDVGARTISQYLSDFRAGER